MGKRLIVELSDKVYNVIQHQAEAAGASPAHWLADALEKQCGNLHTWQGALTRRTAAEKQSARERFERHLGEVDISHAVGGDNEQIDADLAGEYADKHEAA